MTHPPLLPHRYASNIGLLLMNKLLLGSHGFRFPVFLTLCHMLGCITLSTLGEATGVVRRQPVKSRTQALKIAALSLAFLLSVVLGNVALRFIPVSFSQVGELTPYHSCSASCVTGVCMRPGCNPQPP